MDKIKFGTDGWRGIIAEDFTFENVRRVAQAVANYVSGYEGEEEGVVVAFDNRFLSEHFAEAAAEVLAGNLITVYVPERAVPTPTAAHSIKQLKARGAVMITASHNPPEHNGIKFIPDFAGPALPETTNEIEKEIKSIEDSSEIKKMSRVEAEKKGLWKPLNPFEGYKKQVLRLVDEDVIKRAAPKVVVDPLYGAGVDVLPELLSFIGCNVEAIHNYRDPFFGGSMPDPVEKNLSELKCKVLETGAHLGIALDGDADRFGIMDSTGKFFTPNEILFLLLAHFVRSKKRRGSVARTVATTHMLDRLAAKYDMPVKETPVGFKYIGQCLLNDDSIIGGEESGGMSVQGHVPEKDGILGAVLIIELVVLLGNKSLKEFQEELFSEFGKLISRRIDIRVSQEEKERVLDELKGYNPDCLGGQEVADCIRIDGTKIINSDGSWVLIRASGTEPVFRIYIEANSERQLENILSEIKARLSI